MKNFLISLLVSLSVALISLVLLWVVAYVLKPVAVVNKDPVKPNNGMAWYPLHLD